MKFPELHGGDFHLHIEKPDPEVRALLRQIAKQGAQLMTTSTQIQAKLDAIMSKLTAVQAQNATSVEGIRADIASIKANLNQANNGMTEAEVNAAFAPLDQKVAELETNTQSLVDLDAENEGGDDRPVDPNEDGHDGTPIGQPVDPNARGRSGSGSGRSGR